MDAPLSDPVGGREKEKEEIKSQDLAGFELTTSWFLGEYSTANWLGENSAKTKMLFSQHSSFNEKQ